MPIRALCISKIAEALIEKGTSEDAMERVGAYKIYAEDAMVEATWYVFGFIDGVKMRNSLAKTDA